MPTLEYEIQAGYPNFDIAGADEVGRGCLAGPVVAAALVLPNVIHWDQHPWLAQINDSKKLNATMREYLAPLISAWAKAVAIGVVSVEEIDAINIFHASHLAIRRALEGLSIVPSHILVDGKFLPKDPLPVPASAVIKGDQHCLSIAAASIVAKVWRDQQMMQLDQHYPQYGLARHKGYPTPIHKRAIQEHGIAVIHRRSFKLG
jgi:ribonuclease HII